MQNTIRWCYDQFQPTHNWNSWSNKTDANLEDCLHSTSVVILPNSKNKMRGGALATSTPQFRNFWAWFLLLYLYSSPVCQNSLLMTVNIWKLLLDLLAELQTYLVILFCLLALVGNNTTGWSTSPSFALVLQHWCMKKLWENIKLVETLDCVACPLKRAKCALWKVLLSKSFQYLVYTFVLLPIHSDSLDFN